MVAVRANRGESSERLIKRFMKKIKKIELMSELRERRYYKKPSDKRKESKRRRDVTIKKLEKERKGN